MKFNLIVAAALALGVSGAAHADDARWENVSLDDVMKAAQAGAAGMPTPPSASVAGGAASKDTDGLKGVPSYGNYLAVERRYDYVDMTFGVNSETGHVEVYGSLCAYPIRPASRVERSGGYAEDLTPVCGAAVAYAFPELRVEKKDGRVFWGQSQVAHRRGFSKFISGEEFKLEKGFVFRSERFARPTSEHPEAQAVSIVLSRDARIGGPD